MILLIGSLSNLRLKVLFETLEDSSRPNELVQTFCVCGVLAFAPN